MPDAPANDSFEQRLEDLNQLILALESGRLGLEEAIATFERGRKLHQQLLERLKAYERKIEILTKGQGGDECEEAPQLDPAGESSSGDIPF